VPVPKLPEVLVVAFHPPSPDSKSSEAKTIFGVARLTAFVMVIFVSSATGSK
jgi:hypothetical protein